VRATSCKAGGDPTQFDRHILIAGKDGTTTGPGSDRALVGLLNTLGVSVKTVAQHPKPRSTRAGISTLISVSKRQIRELEEHTQRIFRLVGAGAGGFLLEQSQNRIGGGIRTRVRTVQGDFSRRGDGRFTSPALPLNPRSRKICRAAQLDWL